MTFNQMEARLEELRAEREKLGKKQFKTLKAHDRQMDRLEKIDREMDDLAEELGIFDEGWE